MENLNADTIVFIGKTGSGKGTQARLVSKRLGYKLFSTGDQFRKLKSEDSPLGRRVKEIYDKGLLMPHWLASFIFQEAILNLNEGDDIVFEGTGRKIEESELLDEVSHWLNRRYIVFYLNVRDEEVVRRQQERERDNLDQMDKIKRRLEEYRTYTAESVEFFRQKGKLIEINGENSPEEVYQEILSYLRKTS